MTTLHLLLRCTHIAAGSLALASGAASMVLRKGARWHARAGTAFFGSMMAMAGSGATLAAFISPNRGNVMGGLVALYLTLTAWTTAWHPPRRTGRLELAGALLGALTAIAGFAWAFQARGGVRHTLDGYSFGLYLAFGSIALAGTLLDARMLVLGGYAGAQRITRHLSRMCLAMLIATSSFFLGQARLFPDGVRQSGVLRVPVFLVIGALVYWLVRIRLWPVLHRRFSGRAGEAHIRADSYTSSR
jgi:hypothetical protein